MIVLYAVAQIMRVLTPSREALTPNYASGELAEKPTAIRNTPSAHIVFYIHSTEFDGLQGACPLYTDLKIVMISIVIERIAAP